MWQIVLAAAVAGSGLLLKGLRDSKTHSNSSSKPSDQIIEQPNLCSTEISSNQCQKSSIFRFSSASGSPAKTSKKWRKKSGSFSRGGGNVGDEKCGDGNVDLKKSRRRFVVCLNKKNKKTRSTRRYANENCLPKGLFYYWLNFVFSFSKWRKVLIN